MKTLTRNHSGPDDGPEEGEIVSDDLEDISDESMICAPNIGKCLSNIEPVHALSLSSVTDVDETPPEKHRKRRKSYSQRRAKRRRKSRRKTLDSDSSDNDTIVDGRLKFQLKAAVHVGSEEDHKNKSLRTRLRGMVKCTSGPESETVEIEEQKLKQVVETRIANSENKTTSPIAIIDLVEQDTSSCIEILGSGSNSAPENNDSVTEPSKAEDIDSELIQLRIEALKTAINNKFANRKKRKKDGECVASSDDTNKENTSNNSEENLGKKSPEVPQVSPSTNIDSDLPQSPEEDEDVLRAILLASISKKITKSNSESPELVANEAQTKMTVINQNRVLLHKMRTNNFKLNNNVKRVLNKGATNMIKMPQVKPLIINLNSDSDSDLEFSSSLEKSPKKANNGNNNIGITIENTVEQFLKEQRAKVESATPIDGALTTNDLKSPNLSNNQTISNKPQLSVAITSKNSNSNLEKSKSQKTPELEKSALKFLPESKREEYRKLQNLLKLKKAQMKKPKVRKISVSFKTNDTSSKLTGRNQNKNENVVQKTAITPQVLPVKADEMTTQNPLINKRVHQIKNNIPYKKTGLATSKTTQPFAAKAKQNSSNIPVKKIVNNKSSQTTESNHVQLSSAIEARITEFRQQELMAAKREQERKDESLALRAILKQLQTIKDGRLQIHDRYKSLRPLVKKLNGTSKEQKQCEQEIENLMRQLADARAKQEVLHKNMLKSVKELADEKRKIDISLPKTVVTPKTNTLIITSTPIKSGAVTVPLTPGSSFASTLSDGFKSDQSSADKTPGKDETDRNDHVNTWEQSTICNNPVSVADPNDIDSVIKVTKEQVAMMEKKKEKESSHCRKLEKVRYVSPLNVSQRQGTIDPFGIMCPFEVNGTCKDPECSFNHLPK